MSDISNIVDTLKKDRAKIISFGVLVLVIAVMGLYILDLTRKNKAVSQERDTLNVQFQKLGDSYQAQGQAFKTDSEAKSAAIAALGKKVVEVMQANDYSLRVLYQAVGEIKSEVHPGAPVTVKPTPNGGFTDVTLEQARTGPSLSSVTLNYDPSLDPTKRLTSSWLSFKEEFFPVVGEWQKKDGGYTGTIRLTRKVFRPDGKVVGEEEIPLSSATATFGPLAFGGTQALDPVPRFTIFGGIGRDTDQKKVVPVLGMDYRWTTRVGTGAGVVGNTIFGTASYRF